MTVKKKWKTVLIIAAALLLTALCAVAAVLILRSSGTPGLSPAQPTDTQPADTPTPRPDKVTGLNLVVDGDEVFVIWTEVEGADGYILSLTETESGNAVYDMECPTSLVTLTGLDSAIGYTLTVEAYLLLDGRQVTGEKSDPVTTKLPDVPPSPSSDPEPEPSGGDDDGYLIRVNKALNTVTVYSSDDGTALKVFLCSCGDDTPEGTFSIQNKWRWLWMVDDSYGQWVSQISGNYLFHSVPYWGTKDPEQLDVGEYNKLGTTCSHGCVRLRAGDAKWIYDNVPSGTTVVIYSDPTSPGPLGKPSVPKLPEWHTWDPTDPNVSGKCSERGCH